MGKLYLDDEGSSPSTPAAGYKVVYVKSDGFLYYKDSGGNERRVLYSPVAVADGGSGNASLTAYAVLCGGTTSTGAVQSIAGVGTAAQVLTSNGDGALPTFQAASGSIQTIGTKTSLSGTSTDVTGLPSGITSFKVVIADAVKSAGSNIRVQLGTSGGIVSTNYTAFLAYGSSTVAATQSETTTATGIDVATVNADNHAYMVMDWVKYDPSSDLWVCTYMAGVISGTTPYRNYGYAKIALSGTLDRVRVTSSSADSYSAGTVTVIYTK